MNTTLLYLVATAVSIAWGAAEGSTRDYDEGDFTCAMIHCYYKGQPVLTDRNNINTHLYQPFGVDKDTYLVNNGVFDDFRYSRADVDRILNGMHWDYIELKNAHPHYDWRNPHKYGRAEVVVYDVYGRPMTNRAGKYNPGNDYSVLDSYGNEVNWQRMKAFLDKFCRGITYYKVSRWEASATYVKYLDEEVIWNGKRVYVQGEFFMISDEDSVLPSEVTRLLDEIDGRHPDNRDRAFKKEIDKIRDARYDPSHPAEIMYAPGKYEPIYDQYGKPIEWEDFQWSNSRGEPLTGQHVANLIELDRYPVTSEYGWDVFGGQYLKYRDQWIKDVHGDYISEVEHTVGDDEYHYKASDGRSIPDAEFLATLDDLDAKAKGIVAEEEHENAGDNDKAGEGEVKEPAHDGQHDQPVPDVNEEPPSIVNASEPAAAIDAAAVNADVIAVLKGSAEHSPAIENPPAASSEPDASVDVPELVFNVEPDESNEEPAPVPEYDENDFGCSRLSNFYCYYKGQPVLRDPNDIRTHIYMKGDNYFCIQDGGEEIVMSVQGILRRMHVDYEALIKAHYYYDWKNPHAYAKGRFVVYDEYGRGLKNRAAKLNPSGDYSVLDSFDVPVDWRRMKAILGKFRRNITYSGMGRNYVNYFGKPVKEDGHQLYVKAVNMALPGGVYKFMANDKEVAPDRVIQLLDEIEREEEADSDYKHEQTLKRAIEALVDKKAYFPDRRLENMYIVRYQWAVAEALERRQEAERAAAEKKASRAAAAAARLNEDEISGAAGLFGDGEEDDAVHDVPDAGQASPNPLPAASPGSAGGVDVPPRVASGAVSPPGGSPAEKDADMNDPLSQLVSDAPVRPQDPELDRQLASRLKEHQARMDQEQAMAQAADAAALRSATDVATERVHREKAEAEARARELSRKKEESGRGLAAAEEEAARLPKVASQPVPVVIPPPGPALANNEGGAPENHGPPPARLAGEAGEPAPKANPAPANNVGENNGPPSHVPPSHGVIVGGEPPAADVVVQGVPPSVDVTGEPGAGGKGTGLPPPASETAAGGDAPLPSELVVLTPTITEIPKGGDISGPYPYELVVAKPKATSSDHEWAGTTVVPFRRAPSSRSASSASRLRSRTATRTSAGSVGGGDVDTVIEFTEESSEDEATAAVVVPAAASEPVAVRSDEAGASAVASISLGFLVLCLLVTF